MKRYPLIVLAALGLIAIFPTEALAAGKMYYTNTGDDIHRANLDGTGVTQLVWTPMIPPTALFG